MNARYHGMLWTNLLWIIWLQVRSFTRTKKFGFFWLKTILTSRRIQRSCGKISRWSRHKEQYSSERYGQQNQNPGRTTSWKSHRSHIHGSPIVSRITRWWKRSLFSPSSKCLKNLLQFWSVTIVESFQQQQFIELVRENKIEDALKFASDHMAERGEESGSEAILEELERTLALLAFEDPEKSPYSDLLSYSHRQKVQSKYIQCGP